MGTTSLSAKFKFLIFKSRFCKKKNLNPKTARDSNKILIIFFDITNLP